MATYSVSTSVQCTAQGGEILATYTFDNGGGPLGSPMQYYAALYDENGTNLQQLPVSSNGGLATFAAVEDGLYEVRILSDIDGVSVANAFEVVDCASSPGCDLAIGNLVAAAPATRAGTGSVQFTLASSAASVTFSAAKVSQPATPISSGSGAPGVQMLTGLPPGDYQLTIGDSNGCGLNPLPTFTVPAYAKPGCTDQDATNYDPDATDDDGTCEYTPAEPPAPQFQVPLLNALRFVVETSADGCSAFESPDNTLFCAQTRPGQRVRPRYTQKVCRCDSGPVQVLTNYTALTATVRRFRTGQAVATFYGARVQQLTGTAPPIAVSLTDHGDGFTRVTGAAAPLPDNLLRAGRAQLSGGAAGSYAVRLTGVDETTGAPYLVLQRPWQASAGAVQLSWELTGPGFDVWQVVLDWVLVPDGSYYVRLEATAPDYPLAVAESEPVRVANQHPNTVLVEYKNADNCFGMVWATGITPRLRVDGMFFRQQNGGTLSVHRNSNGTPTVLSSTAQRKLLLETDALPDYLHEKLFLACRLDWLRVNGLRCQTEDAYEAQEQTTYPLRGGKVALEQLEWLGAGNGDDAGPFTPNQDSLLTLRGGGFLKLRGA